MEITALTGIYSVSVSSLTCRLMADAVGEVMTERHVSTLDHGKLDRGHCDVFYQLKK
jgi:hypothetical protein